MVAGTTLLRFFSANRSAVTIGVNVLLDEIHPISLHTSYYPATIQPLSHWSYILTSFASLAWRYGRGNRLSYCRICFAAGLQTRREGARGFTAITSQQSDA